MSKKKISEAEKYFYCYVITQNRFRYSSHGREANKTLDDLPVPSPNELPKWINKAISKVKEPDKEPLHNEYVCLKDRYWKWVNLIEYFSMSAGKYYPKDSYSDGNTPLVTSSDNNNGVMTFTDMKPKYKNCLTIGKFGCSVYYQERGFVASSDVTILKPKFDVNSFHAMFIVSLINKEGYKWSYGRQIRLNDSEKLKIKLPVTRDGKPDWEFMKYYIKSLPYSSSLKEKQEKGLSDEELIEKHEAGGIDLGKQLKKIIN